MDVDDAVAVIGKFCSSGIRNLEATRFAHGRKNQLAFEINGSAGSISFDLERMNQLRYFQASGPIRHRGFRNILVTEPSHPYVGKWWPAGHILGYEHSFVHTVADFVNAVVKGKSAEPDFNEGLRNQRVLDAIMQSMRQCSWIQL